MEAGTQVAPQGGDFLGAIVQIISFIFFFWLIILAIGISLFVLKKTLSKFLFARKVQSKARSDDKSYLSIKIPPSNEQKENAMDDFLKSIHRILPTSAHISLEMVSTHQYLSFYIVLNKEYKNALESQLYAQFPDAEIVEVEDYLKELSDNAALAEFKFRRASSFPIADYSKLKEDLLKNISAMLAKTDADEKVYIQLSLKRVGSKFWERDYKHLSHHLAGKKFDEDDKPTPTHHKLSQDLYLGSFRIIYQANEKATAQAKLNTLVGLLKSLKSEHNELKKTRAILGGNLLSAIKARMFESGDFWTTSELATIYHFPYKGNIVSNVVQTTSKRSPAPDIIPFEGQVDPNEVSFFATTNYRNEYKKFGVKRIDRRRHMYVVGKTGSGKSRLLELLLISDIQSGQGCCLLDPHGDLAQELLMFIPKERIKDVVYVDPSDRNFPIGFNPLEPVEDYEVRQHLSTFFISIFKKLFAATWNQRMEHMIRFITLALLETPDSNVLGIPRILQDTAFRQRVVMQIKDPVVKNFWTTEFAGWNQQYSGEAIVPIINKVGQFAANPIVRNMIGQRKNALNFEDFMNSGKIVLLNISKGKLGEENANLLGSMFITKIQQAALARARVPEDERRDFYFYVDEFQNFATDAFSSILSEARKYHLDLTIAHQYIAQLPDEVKATAFGNVGTIIAFPIGGDDAAYLAKEFSPTFTADDMINLNLREMYIKMSVDGRITAPFSARTIDVPKPLADYSLEILDHSRIKYGRNRVEVENEIAQWTNSVNAAPNSGSDEGFPEPLI